MKIKRLKNKRHRKLITQFHCPFCFEYYIKLASPLAKYRSYLTMRCTRCNREFKYEYDN